MTIPPERVAQVCGLGIDEASLMLERAKAGDLSALANWVIYSVFLGHLRRLDSHPTAAKEAEALTIEMLGQIDLSVRRRAANG